MRVIHVIWNAKFGGIEKLVYDLAIAQNEVEAIDAHIFIAKEEGEFLDKFKATKIQLYFSKLKKGFDLNLNEYRKVRTLFKKYEVVHFHIFNPLLILCAIGLSCKIVFTEHGNFGFGRKKKKSDGVMTFAKKYFLKYFTSWITYNSHFTKKSAVNLYNIHNQKNMSVVYNGVQLSDNNSNPLSIEVNKLAMQLKSKVVIGTSSRFVSFKRIDRLITAFSQIDSIEKSVLLLVGDGVLLPELKKQVEVLKISDSVIFTGYVSNVRDFQQLMNVCVFPSQSEPFGLVAIETLSLNKPTLVFSDGGGLKEIIENISENDVVSDEIELTNRLNDYISNAAEITETKTSRVEYAKGFDIKITCKRFIDIYGQLR